MFSVVRVSDSIPTEYPITIDDLVFKWISSKRRILAFITVEIRCNATRYIFHEQ